MAYSASFRKDRITVLNRKTAVTGNFGLDSAGVEWEETTCLWASVTWAKGNRALNAGAIDVYGVVTVRMLYSDEISMRSRIVHEDTTYQILPETFHADKRANEIQFQAQAIINEQ